MQYTKTQSSLFILNEVIYTYFWDYTIIILFPLPFPTSLLAPFQIHDLFLLIVSICLDIYIYIYSPKSITITCSVCTVLLICMFSGPVIWYLITNCHALSCGRLLLIFSAFFSCVKIFQTLGSLFHSLWCVYCCFHCPAHVYNWQHDTVNHEQHQGS